jgi:hypothetical protein
MGYIDTHTHTHTLHKTYYIKHMCTLLANTHTRTPESRIEYARAWSAAGSAVRALACTLRFPSAAFPALAAAAAASSPHSLEPTLPRLPLPPGPLLLLLLMLMLGAGSCAGGDSSKVHSGAPEPARRQRASRKQCIQTLQ